MPPNPITPVRVSYELDTNYCSVLLELELGRSESIHESARAIYWFIF